MNLLMDCGGTSESRVAGQIMEIEKETLDQLYVTTMRVERESHSKLVGKYNLVKQKAFTELLFSHTCVYHPPVRPSAPLLFFRGASINYRNPWKCSMALPSYSHQIPI